ncbi:MAG: hypothetical protein ACKOET_19510 [Verrucomicrobiota bacterium]
MRRFWVIVSLVLAFCWAPVSSHPFLEAAGLIHQNHPAHDHPAHVPADHPGADHSHAGDAPGDDDADHEVADGLCRAESVGIQLPVVSPRWVEAWRVTGPKSAPLILPGGPDRPGPSPPGTSPPEITPHWRFSLRAALPVRAPSFVS